MIIEQQNSLTAKGSIEIDTDIPFSTAKKSRASKILALPFEQLEPGNSFHVATTPDTHKEQAAKLSSWVRLASKRLDKRFTLRSVTAADPRGLGLRVWRMADDLSRLFTENTPPWPGLDRLPNATTAAALDAAERGEVTRFESFETLMANLASQEPEAALAEATHFTPEPDAPAAASSVPVAELPSQNAALELAPEVAAATDTDLHPASLIAPEAKPKRVRKSKVQV